MRDLARELARRERVRNKAFDLMDRGRPAEAEDLLLPLTLDEDPAEDSASHEGPYEMSNELEMRYFFETHPEARSLRTPTIPKVPALTALCLARVQQGHLDGALEAVEMALNRSPVSADIWFQKLHIFKVQGRSDEVFSASLEVHRLCYLKRQLAHSLCNFAHCLVERRQWDPAIAVSLLSLEMEKTPMALQELRFIEGATGKILSADYYNEHLIELLEQAGVPLGPDPAWVRLAANLGLEYIKDRRPKEAHDYLAIAHALKPDPGLARVIAKLRALAARQP